MCLIIFAYQAHKEFPLLVAANRDELYERASEASHFWPDKPDLLAGRDCCANGTWMGISKRGRFAGVTNGIQAKKPDLQVLSRGSLTVDFLAGEMSAEQYAREVHSRAGNFNSFNLIVYDMKSMWYVNSNSDSLSQSACKLAPGIYGLSNAGMYSAWPKCEIGRKRMSTLLDNNSFEFKDLSKAISSRKLAPKSQLKNLGLCEQKDLLLSSQFVSTETYGTRCSTLVSINSKQTARWLENSFDSSCKLIGSIDKVFDLKLNSNTRNPDE